jgi:hypothetical protein
LEGASAGKLELEMLRDYENYWMNCKLWYQVSFPKAMKKKHPLNNSNIASSH